MKAQTIYIYTDTNQPLIIDGHRVKLSEWQFDAERMGAAPTASGTIHTKSCPDSFINEQVFVTIAGFKLYAKTVQSEKSNGSLAYQAKITFEDNRGVLDTTLFLDVVTDDTDAAYTDRFRSNSAKFSTFCDINELAARINDSLIYSHLYDKATGEGYHVVIDEGVTSEPKSISFDATYISSAIAEFYNTFEIPYYWVGNTCHVGSSENIIDHRFQYGRDKGLLSITKNDSTDIRANRITGYGSSENIPYYYPNADPNGRAVFTTENWGAVLPPSISLSKLIAVLPEYIGKKLTIARFSSSEPVNILVNWPAPYVEYNVPSPTGFQDTGRTHDLSVEWKLTVVIRKGDKVDFSSLNSYLYTEVTTIGSGTIGSRKFTNVPEGSSWSLSVYVTRPDGKEDATTITEKNPVYNASSTGSHTFTFRSDFSLTVKWDNTSGPLLGFGVRNTLRILGAVYLIPGNTDVPCIVTPDNTVIALDDSGISIPNVSALPYASMAYSISGGKLAFNVSNSSTAAAITISAREYIQPASALMPSIYRQSLGAERFYNAENNKYTDPVTGEPVIFEAPYVSSKPREVCQTYEDIKPTIRNVRNKAGQLIGVIEDVAFDLNDSDEAKETNDGSQLEYVHSYFYVKLRVFDGNYGFNLFQQALASGAATVKMASGNCAPCEFEIGVSEPRQVGDHYEFDNPVQVDVNGNIVAGDFNDKVDFNNIQPSQQDTSKNSVWIALKKEATTFGVVMPNATNRYYPQPGDEFVLVNINFPQQYIDAAEAELDKVLINDLYNSNRRKFSFNISLSRIFLNSHTDIEQQLSQNSMIFVAYDGSEYALYVTAYHVKADGNIINEISVDVQQEVSSPSSGFNKAVESVSMNVLTNVSVPHILSESDNRYLRKNQPDTATRKISFLDGISVDGTAEITSALSLIGNIINSVTTEKDAYQKQLLSDNAIVTEKALAQMFLRKNQPDTAQALITFLQGFLVGNTFYGMNADGDATTRNINNADTITTVNLEVQGAAHFFQLVIDQARSVGGRIVLSLASCDIAHVEYLAADGTTVQEGYSSDTAYFRCYFRADDNNASTTNNFSPGDLAICQTFNIGEGEHSDTGNTFYWRKVTYCSYSALTYDFDRNGNKYYFINLSNRLGEYADNSNAIPTIGDSIVQLGNWSVAERASAIVLSAYDDGWLDTEIKAPSIAQYVGAGMDETDRWNMAKCRYTWLARNGNQITGNLRVVTAEGTKEVTEYVSSEVATQTEAIVDTKVTEKTAELSETVDGLSSTVSQHTTEINTISGNLQTTTALVNSHTTKINQNTSSISAQATSLQTVQQNISDIETQFDNLSDTVDSQQATIDGLPLKTDAELAEYKGEILVESKQIALEVSEITDVRRNMFMGTQFWKNIGYDTDGYRVNGSGATLIRRTADTINGHNSLEISSSSTSNTYGGIYFLNIPVEAGKSYTISVWAKRMSSSLGNGAWMILHYKANSEQGTPTWQESQRLVTTANTIGEWVLIKKTITPKAGDYFVNVIFCLTSSGKIRIAEPMMEESEEYTAWSPSPKDYAYVMGNMLPDTDTLKAVGSGEGLTQVNGRTADTDEAGIYTAKGTATATYVASSSSWTAGYNTLITIRKAFSKGYSYILSFYARRTSAASDYAGLCVNFGSNVLIAEHSTGVSRFSEDQGSSPYSGYVKIKNVPTTWTRYWVHVITNDNVTLTPQIYIEVTGGTVGSGGNISGNTGTFLVKKPKLEYGAVVTEWTASTDDLAEEETIANQLHKTGINITQGTIRLTAKNTIIDGDLYLRGVLVENYGQTERYSLVICDTVQNKSVSVQQAVVVLPMISPQTIYKSTGGTPETHVVAAVKEAGVKLTIAAKYDSDVAKWASATPELYASYPDAMGSFHDRCTKVFADPRIASCTNYTAPNVATVLPEGGGGVLASGYEGGVFVCNGRRGRVLLLMPGQTLHLTSAIETINGTDHLLWYVDNGSEFAPLTKIVTFIGDYEYRIGFQSSGGSAWPMEVDGSSGSECMDNLFGARVLDSVYSGKTDELDIQL